METARDELSNQQCQEREEMLEKFAREKEELEEELAAIQKDRDDSLMFAENEKQQVHMSPRHSIRHFAISFTIQLPVCMFY